MTDDLEALAKSLTEAHKKAILRAAGPGVHRAGDLYPGKGHLMAQGFLRESPIFERYFHWGYLAYRLTPLGKELALRTYLQERERG